MTTFDFTTLPNQLGVATVVGAGTESHDFALQNVDFTLSIHQSRADQISYLNQGFDGGLAWTNTSGMPGQHIALNFEYLDGTKVQNVFTGTQIRLEYDLKYGGAGTFLFIGDSTSFTMVAGQGRSQTVTASGNFTEIRFYSSSAGQMVLKSLDANIKCFLTGTRIATTHGDVAVETLQPGDKILRADGGVTTVKWLGEQQISTRFLHPAKVNPIRISAGALGEDLPKRDLFVTADHALGLDGMLVNAGALVNGTTITQMQTMPRDGFSYWHVETEGHELILAEGCPAESFIDYVGRDGFDTATGEASTTRIAEMPLPRISAARHLPDSLSRRIHPSVAA